MSSSAEELEEISLSSSSEPESSSDDSDDESEEDQFDQFARYRGVGQIKTVSKQPVMCLHYFSNALGLQFGNQNEEVYRLDQIEEWAPREAKWLEGPSDLLGRIESSESFESLGQWSNPKREILIFFDVSAQAGPEKILILFSLQKRTKFKFSPSSSGTTSATISFLLRPSWWFLTPNYWLKRPFSPWCTMACEPPRCGTRPAKNSWGC